MMRRDDDDIPCALNTHSHLLRPNLDLLRIPFLFPSQKEIHHNNAEIPHLEPSISKRKNTARPEVM